MLSKYKSLTMILLLVLGTGFQTLPIPKWDIDRDGVNVIWIRPDAELLDFDFPKTDIEQAKPFEDLQPPQLAIAMLKHMINEYNSISTSFIRLQLYPVDGYDFGEPDPLDVSFNEDQAENRIVDFKFGGTFGFGGGAEARPEVGDSGFLSHCSVVFGTEPNTMFMLKGGLHEIGHCLGLAHAHDDKNSIMSYNGITSTQTSLGIDDKMGITYLYPSKPEYAQEAATLGLACSRKQ